ncbi:hypothetical protein GFS31_00980 [Leptolyngbya sp. BL0902]|uniref:hypothetical protein n=1 Tax=Leptolyngbya sp. BL0902 TaxID=1115757 RepID=UPI0018E84DA0|nr:hypothetical protein [Leptolyngbya sp. BL0902]QQE63433.1 hypothetical protein GFS31_00980 [Leptolyngbya sp. BL0902]
MLQAIEGIYRNGKIELLEQPVASEGMRVIVTFLDGIAESVAASSSPVDLEEQGIGLEQAADLRSRLKTFAEDWDSPEMDIYDEL